MIWKRCSRCGKRLPTGVTCDCINKRYKEYDKFSRNKESADFYHSTEWEKMRRRVLDKFDGVDLWMYYKTGQIVAADTVHHIEPLTDAWDKRLDINNLIPVSSSSHNEIHKLYETKQQETMKALKTMLTEFEP